MVSTQERFERHVVGVEHHDDRRFRMGEAVVEIARLGVLVVCTGEIVRTEVVAQHAAALRGATSICAP